MIKSFQGRHRFLSNFFLAPVLYDGIEYPSSEHAYQAAKSVRTSAKEYIAKLATAGAAKSYGKKVGLRPDWEDIKLDVMFQIVSAKFSQNPELRESLVATGEKELVEGNTWGDTFWGVCDGVGENHLGKILMRVRKALTPTP